MYKKLPEFKFVLVLLLRSELSLVFCEVATLVAKSLIDRVDSGLKKREKKIYTVNFKFICFTNKRRGSSLNFELSSSV